MRRRTLTLLTTASLAVLVIAASAVTAQVTPDYLLMSRCVASYDQTRPGGNFSWQTGFSFVHIQDQATGTGGWEERHTFQYTAYAYTNGPNGYAEYGTGDDICLGPIEDLAGGVHDYSVVASAPECASGTRSLTESPTGNYGGNRNISAEIDQSFNLAGASDVQLLFFHHHALRWTSSSDRGHIEVSTNGGTSWVQVDPYDTPAAQYYRYYFGDNHQFKRGGADLSNFAGQTIRVRLRFSSSSSSHDDGWFIDDVRLLVDGNTVFFDDFELGSGNWSLESFWGLSNAGYSYESGLGSIDQNGLYSVTPVTAPVSVGEGMGFNAVRGAYTLSGTTREVFAKVYHTAPQYVAPPDLGYEDICQTSAAVEDAGAPIHTRMALQQNSPNPFNPSTAIGFRLESDGRATLRIFDGSGRLVHSILANAALPSGEHVFTWDGRDNSGTPQPSGVYLYQLEAGGQTVSRKMVMVR